ncbi:MAG: hypothetical protein ABIP94_16070 [Planctomycetota bacterium]
METPFPVESAAPNGAAGDYAADGQAYYTPTNYGGYYGGYYGGHYYDRGYYPRARWSGPFFPVHAAVGAGIGAVIGNQHGHRGRGAFLGGSLGFLFDLHRLWR